MCGVIGGFWNRPNLFNSEKFDKGLELLFHRGPNDKGATKYYSQEGLVVLGHTRLSIIDLSTAGHQPMVSDNDRYSIIFNGEIYNYKELRGELSGIGYSFFSDSDTEVLLKAWQEWQEKSLQRLIGMFAFVVFDKREKIITCVRDPFGIKPFFYTFEEANFYFASEINALKALKCHKVELNTQKAYDYLVHGVYDNSADTFYKDVKHLPPASILKFNLKSGEKVLNEWWRPSLSENQNLGFEDASSMVREQFLKNVELHLRSDVPLAASLSGGIDSSAIVCAMRFLEPDMDINTFSFIASNGKANEEKWVDIVNKYTKAKSHKISVNSTNLIKDIDEMIIAQGEPFGSTSIYAQYNVFRTAKKNGITVMLEGQGADELLAGYEGYPGSRLQSILEEGDIREAYNFLKNWSEWPGRKQSTAIKKLISNLMPDNTQSLMRNLNGMPVVPNWLDKNILQDYGVVLKHPKNKYALTDKKRRVIAELANALNKRGLPHLLRHGDRNSMAFSIESRVPFLTLEMANLMLSMPESYLISQSGETKHIFRHAMKGIVPDEILYRKDKIGFETPELKWFIESQDILKNWLAEDLRLQFLKQDKVLQEFDNILSGKIQFSWQAWRWINFSRWYQLSF